MTYKGKIRKEKEVDVIEGYNTYAPFYEKDESYLNTFDQKLLLRALRDIEDKKILDIGCGTGRLVPVFQKRGAKEVVGLDVSEGMLDIAKKHNFYTDLIQADIREELPLDWDSFDIIICSLVIVHLRDRELPPFFEELFRILRHQGELYLTNIPQRRAPALPIEGNKKIYIKSYQHKDSAVKKDLMNAGFAVWSELHQEERGENIATLFVAKNLER